MKRIFLIGYMGAGKTTFGRELAKLMNLDFIDLDHFIQNRYNKSIGQLFDQLGEDKFREIEHKLLQEVSEFENVIISTGGGTPCFYDNMEIMNSVGNTVYLKADTYTLSKRLNACKDKRPLIKDKNEEEILHFVTINIAKRELFYNKARLVFETEELTSKEEVSKYVASLKEKLQDTNNV